MKKLSIGESDFKNLISSNSYYIDKSLFIQEFIDSPALVMLFPRPRRFGKTLNLSMLKYYFDVAKPENKALFTDLKIWQAPEDIKAHCSKYPVIYISFKDAKANNWDDCYQLIISEILKGISQFDYLIESNILSSYKKNELIGLFNRTAGSSDYQQSLRSLSEYLYNYHNQKVIILIDEYDTPIHAGYKKFYTEVVSFMRNLLSGAFKDNSFLFKGAITGILRVSKESIFSGLNNISVYSILEDEFADMFGFTEPDVQQLLSDFNVKTEFAEIKKWYNGYKFGSFESIYNPWSILNFTASKNETLRSFWANTSSNELIRHEITKRNADLIRKNILKLIADDTIVNDIETEFVFSDMDKRTNLVWSLFLFSGYLTTVKQVSRKGYELKIPNFEIKAIFQDSILEWFETDLKIVKNRLTETAQFLTENKLAEFEYNFRELMGDTFSYYDTAKNNEYVYQSYILGLLAVIGDDYIIRSNRESGLGRYDIMLIPHDKTKNGVVIEIKQTEARSENDTDRKFKMRVNKLLKQALEQIDKNQYYNELLAHQIPPERIIKVPIVFAGKIAFVQAL